MHHKEYFWAVAAAAGATLAVAGVWAAETDWASQQTWTPVVERPADPLPQRQDRKHGFGLMECAQRNWQDGDCRDQPCKSACDCGYFLACQGSLPLEVDEFQRAEICKLVKPVYGRIVACVEGQCREQTCTREHRKRAKSAEVKAIPN